MTKRAGIVASVDNSLRSENFSMGSLPRSLFVTVKLSPRVYLHPLSNIDHSCVTRFHCFTPVNVGFPAQNLVKFGMHSKTLTKAQK